MKSVNKHFGDWLLLHLLLKNIDRRTFQEIVNSLCEDVSLKRNLTYISEDLEHEDKNCDNDDYDTDISDKFFLPGNARDRKLAVNFE